MQQNRVQNKQKFKDALDGSDIAMSQLAAYTATMSQHKGNVTMTVVL